MMFYQKDEKGREEGKEENGQAFGPRGWGGGIKSKTALLSNNC